MDLTEIRQRSDVFLAPLINFSETIKIHFRQSKDRKSVCRALPAHVSVSLHIPVVLSVIDQLKEQVSISANKQNVYMQV